MPGHAATLVDTCNSAMRTHPHPTHSRRAALEDGHDLQLRCLIELRSFPEVLPELLQQISAQSDCDFRKCRLHDEGHLCGSVVLQKKPRLGKGHSQSDLTNCDQSNSANSDTLGPALAKTPFSEGRPLCHIRTGARESSCRSGPRCCKTCITG